MVRELITSKVIGKKKDIKYLILQKGDKRKFKRAWKNGKQIVR